MVPFYRLEQEAQRRMMTEVTALVNGGAEVQPQLLIHVSPPALSGPGDTGGGAAHQSRARTDLSPTQATLTPSALSPCSFLQPGPLLPAIPFPP